VKEEENLSIFGGIGILGEFNLLMEGGGPYISASKKTQTESSETH
jgi:hypothetical protein